MVAAPPLRADRIPPRLRTMQPEERLAYEDRVRMRQVVLAGAAGVLVMLAVLVQLPGAHVKVNEETLGLITEHKRIAQDIAGSLISALGSLALGSTLWWLFEAARARDPRVRPAFMGPVAFAAGAISAVAVVATAIASAHAADEFVGHGNQTWVEAHALITKAWFVIPEVAGYLGAFMVAISLVLVSLAAMRVGLLPRFMGYLGIVAGVLTILPFLPIPIVEAYWLLALAYLLSGRWPSGVPPAWSSGVAVPWPRQPRAERTQSSGRARGRTPKPVPQPAGATGGTGGPGDRASNSTRATTPKRKRKRRK
jgi:hypothetical protein